MSFSEFYNAFKDAEIPVSRNKVRSKIIELTEYNRISYARMSLDTSVCRGMFIDARNPDHQFFKQHKGPVVVTARGLNRCWARFVVVKEMLHAFSDDKEVADTGKRFDALISDLAGTSREISGQMRSELEAFWRTLAILCPEKHRQQFKEALKNNEIQPYDVALKFRIPELYVNILFEPLFDEALERVI